MISETMSDFVNVEKYDTHKKKTHFIKENLFKNGCEK